MKTKVRIPITEIKEQIIGVRLTPTEISKVKSFCRKNRITQSNLIRYAIKNYRPGLLK
jgi:hypothetical protein